MSPVSAAPLTLTITAWAALRLRSSATFRSAIAAGSPPSGSGAPFHESTRSLTCEEQPEPVSAGDRHAVARGNPGVSAGYTRGDGAIGPDAGLGRANDPRRPGNACADRGTQCAIRVRSAAAS